MCWRGTQGVLQGYLGRILRDTSGTHEALERRSTASPKDPSDQIGILRGVLRGYSEGTQLMLRGYVGDSSSCGVLRSTHGSTRARARSCLVCGNERRVSPHAHKLSHTGPCFRPSLPACIPDLDLRCSLEYKVASAVSDKKCICRCLL